MQAIYRAPMNYFVPAVMDAQPFDQDIANGREFDNPGWEISGFELMKHQSAVTDWSDEEQIQALHYDELSDFAKQLTGADHALIGSHILRNPEQAALHEDLGPIQFVHSDFAASYHQLMVEYYKTDTPEAKISLEGKLQPEDVAKARRMVILQFWRNVGPSVMDLPIAFCDARTVPADEVVAAPVEDYAGGGFDFETLAVLHSKDEQHKWYTYPEMQIDEVVTFRTYDSALVGTDKPFWTPHSAFRNPDVALGEPSRYSIELRATCLWL